MPTITEGQLNFDFPNGWVVSKFDEWSFYRNQFSRVGDADVICKNCDRAVRCPACGARRIAGTKGIDILALDAGKICWHIEVKDYRVTRESRFDFLADVVALKVRDTLACLAAAQLNANDNTERDRAKRAMNSVQMRVVLHLEQPPSHNQLISLKTQRANVLQRLKQLVKAVDPHPRVVSMDDMDNVDWSVTQVGTP